MYFPSGLNATEYTAAVCFTSENKHFPAFGSHNRIFESHDPLASTRFAFGFAEPAPVGLHLTVYTCCDL